MVLGGYLFSFAQHPSLLFTQEEVNEIRAGKGTVPAFDKSLSEVLTAANAAVNSPVSVPVPIDGGGGVVHEQHKSNYYAMFHCGVAYQLTGDKKYAAFVADMLEAYAKLYPTLGFHPLQLSPVLGRLFWQTLNESVWLMHTAVAYDCIYNTLSPKQRATIEKNLFVPMADFIMDGMGDNYANNNTFNKMHNHVTWATAAVGIIGFAMNREDYVKKAFYGSDGTGKRGGFTRQMDYLFSPDGYFTEGAYYQRYAIWPFVIFAQCIENKLPDLKIFNYRDNILSKALSTLIQFSYEGEFFHINDALLKGLSAQELVYAVDILYNVNPSDKSLLSVANKYQHTYLPTIGGFKVARVSLNFPYTKAGNELKTLGTKDGYQHLWLEAWGQNKNRNTSSFTFVNQNRFYTISAATTPQTEMKMLRLGANDPDFNLRNETAFLMREKARKNHTFATSIETHGEYDVVMETSSNLTSSCEEVKVVMDTASYTVVKATYKGGHSVMLCLSNTDADREKEHRLTVEGTMYAWNGRCGVFMK